MHRGCHLWNKFLSNQDRISTSAEVFKEKIEENFFPFEDELIFFYKQFALFAVNVLSKETVIIESKYLHITILMLK